MAKSAKKSNKPQAAETDNDESDEREERAAPAPDSPEELARVRTRNTIITSIFVAITAASIGFVLWHRPRDPGRVWLNGVVTRHNDRVAKRLTQCFGGETATQIRANLPEIRRGTLPASMRNCRGSTLTELLATPLAVAGDLGTAPGYADNGRRRAWDAYTRLQTALRSYERALNGVPEGQANVPEPARDSLASALDDVAADADSARSVMTDLRNVVEENASWY